MLILGGAGDPSNDLLITVAGAHVRLGSWEQAMGGRSGGRKRGGAMSPSRSLVRRYTGTQSRACRDFGSYSDVTPSCSGASDSWVAEPKASNFRRVLRKKVGRRFAIPHDQTRPAHAQTEVRTPAKGSAGLAMDDRDGDSPRLDGGDALQAPLRLIEGATTAASAFDVATLRAYLSQLLPLIIQADPEDLEPLLESREFAERASRWATDPNAGALYVVKQRQGRDEQAPQGGSAIGNYIGAVQELGIG